MVCPRGRIWDLLPIVECWPLWTLSAIWCAAIVIAQNDVFFHHQCHKSYYHLPACVDHPDGYGCRCGPGFVWNTRMCVASGLDSHLNFDNSTPLRYTELLNKPFPELTAFTIAFWVKVNSSEHPGTVLSYSSQEGTPNVLLITTGPTLTLKVHGEIIYPGLKLNSSRWTHLTWTWTSQDGRWRLYVDGSRMTKGEASRSDRPIPGGGDLVLGQVSRTTDNPNHFDLRYAFVGEIAFANIWRRFMSRTEALDLYKDCKLLRCGDAVEWADFRSGTRGAMKIKWPSTIFAKPCFSDEDSASLCDRHCSIRRGAQCNEEIEGNVRWMRTQADHNATMPCPGSGQTVNITNRGIVHIVSEKQLMKEFAYRECFRTSDTDGKWRNLVLDECTSPDLVDIKRDVKAIHTSPLNESLLFAMCRRLETGAAMEVYNNPIDLAVVLGILNTVITEQSVLVSKRAAMNSSRAYGLSRTSDLKLYPTVEDTYNLSSIIVNTINNLLREKNDAGWLAAQPKGKDGNQLLQTLSALDHLLVNSLDLHISKGEMLRKHATFSLSQTKLVFNVRYINTKNFETVSFPNATDFHNDVKRHKRDNMSVSGNMFDFINNTDIPEHIIMSTGWFAIAKTVPNHNLTGKYKKEDNINSALFYIALHGVEFDHTSVTGNVTDHGVQMKFTYNDNFNISNPECVRFLPGYGSYRWRWTREGCHLASNTSAHTVCYCRAPGIFAVLTDMYDVNWDKGDKPLVLMDVPSYIGCSMSAVLCLMSIILLIYYRTSSKTAALHKNFAMSIILSQLSFMFGVDRVQHEIVCHVFAIGFHYFFLASFAWLMNEAFNLYIVITYAAHSHGEHTEGGSQWRYYILGWILPGVLVGAFVGTHQDDYYADDMCWIAWQYVWLFLGPAIGIISVTVLVLIFIAKEHHETAYSKNEQTNNMIIIYSKALWTQTILITLCWSFAFLSIKMTGIIIKCLYALFNGLQGAFFMVFYFLLHDEVQTKMKARVKKKTLATQGYDYSNASSMEDSIAFAHELEDMNSPGMSGSSALHKAGMSNKLRTETTLDYSSDDEEDDNSDDGDELVTAV